jgi:hypothetical protein
MRKPQIKFFTCVLAKKRIKPIYLFQCFSNLAMCTASSTVNNQSNLYIVILQYLPFICINDLWNPILHFFSNILCKLLCTVILWPLLFIILYYILLCMYATYNKLYFRIFLMVFLCWSLCDCVLVVCSQDNYSNKKYCIIVE